MIYYMEPLGCISLGNPTVQRITINGSIAPHFPNFLNGQWCDFSHRCCHKDDKCRWPRIYRQAMQCPTQRNLLACDVGAPVIWNNASESTAFFVFRTQNRSLCRPHNATSTCASLGATDGSSSRAALVPVYCASLPTASTAMAELLLRWINHELGLSTHVTNVEMDFASGYLLGEILHRLNHQHNFADFMRSSSADAKILNFCLLEPTLRNLNVNFDANVAVAIMNEKKNAAANLLYQIKIAASRVGRAPAVSTKSLERTGIIPLHNRPVKLAKPVYDTEKLRLFEHSVRRHVRSITSLQQDKDQIVDEANKKAVHREKMAEQKEILEATKAERLHRAYIHSSFIKEALEETDSPAWRLALQKKSAREQRRAAFLQQLMKKREETEENLTFSLRQKVRNDLNDFDAEGESKNSLAGEKVTSRKSVGYGLRSLTTALNESSNKKTNSTPNLPGSSMNERELYHANASEMESASSVIKQQRKEREKRKENLSRRRKRFVQECVYSHTRVGTARVAGLLEDVVLRDTNGEKDVHGEMDRILIYKEVARENRSMRNQEYMNQKELDSVAAIDRDTGCYHNLLLRFEDDREMQTTQQKNVQVSVESADHFLCEEISSAIMHELVEFMLFVAGKREETLHSRDPSVFLTAETWNEYKIKFANGCNIGNPSPAPATNNSSQAELLDKHELEIYLSSFLPFQTTSEQQAPLTTINNGSLFIGAEEVIKDCFILGEEIKSLRWITYLSSSDTNTTLEKGELQETTEPSVPLSLQSSLGSHQHLRILVFGPPFAGKETQAKLLGDTYNLSVLSVHDLIQNAVQNTSDIGIVLNSLLVNGKEISPELYSRLVMETIGEIESQTLVLNTDTKAGWVIYDLPATERHDQSLEECLTGYMDPALVPSPYDFESVIAPGRSKPPLSSSFFHGKSGVDLVFHIDCPATTVLDRCLGQVEDTTAGSKNHLVFDPPQDDSIVRHRLQHVSPTAYASEFLSLYCLANDGFSHDHKAWHAKFNTLHELSNTGMTVSEIHDAIANIVNNLLNEKKEEANTKQFELEAGEQALMVSEEERQRRLDAFASEIDEAEVDVAKMQALMTEAEEAKAKKEEILEIRQKLEEAQRHLDGVLIAVNNWVEEERSRRPVPSSKYSGELGPATARALTALWNDMEVEYVVAMKTSFALLREERHRVANRAQIMAREFCEFVRRPDQKQELVNVFQRQFNEVIDEMRFNDLTKVELHARADILQDELGALVELKFTQNDEELCSLVGDGWTEDTCRHVAAIYQMALQAECDRFRTSVQILVDGHYAASSDRSQLNSIVEIWHSHQPRLEMACRVYRDPTSEVPVETSLAPAATGKAVPKGKVKAPAVAPPANTATTSEDALAEFLTLTELLAEYGHVLQRCSSWMEAINSIAGAHEQAEEDICKVNLLDGIRYEYGLMERRVRFLQEATEKNCDEITRSMRSIEITLRDVLEDRKDREQAAVAAVIEYVRSAIETEVALPVFIDVSPEFVERFPTTVQLREDTMVCIDGRRRLLPRYPSDAPPIVEETHELLLNPRQRNDLREALISHTIDNSGLLPLIALVETITALTSLSDALPEVWRRCPAHAIAKIAATFTVKQSAFVDIEALLMAMSTREDLLQQFQEDEAREELERHQQLELEQQEHERELLLQQQQNENNEAAPADLAQQ